MGGGGAWSAPIAEIAGIARDRRDRESGKSKVIERHNNGDRTAARVPEARYAYYRRCQVFRKGGEQCKAPAEKGSHICYAHAGQLATAVRRERERRAVLEEAVAQMRKRGRPCEMADLFMDFKSINVTLAVAAQAVIAGRIDCKTAGRLLVQLQTFSKLLWQIHRKGTSTTEARRHGEKPRLPQIYADERRLDRTGEKPSLTAETLRRGENRISLQICADERGLGKPGEKPHLTTEARRHGEKPRSPQLYGDERRLDKPVEKPSLTAETLRRGELQSSLNTDYTDLKNPNLTAEARRRGENRISPQICADERGLGKPGEKPHLTTEARRHGEVLRTKENWAANHRAEMRIALVAKVLAIANRRDWAHAPPELLRAA
jgi:hypothetical protein